MHLVRRINPTLAAFGAVFCLGSIPASAATVRVPADQPTIRAGVLAAAEGDTVLVAPGTYSGSGNRDINFNGTNRVLLAEDGPEVTIIDLGGSGRGFLFDHEESHASRVQGFTIRNGDRGLECVGASPTIVRCIFEDNDALGDLGSAVDLLYSSARFEFCVFQRNEAGSGESLAGAFSARGIGNDSVSLYGCEFRENFGDQRGGAIGTSGIGNLQLIGCRFESNVGGVSGGAVYCYLGSLEVRDCRFVGNTTGSSGGGIASIQNVTLLEGCLFSGNVARSSTGHGGGFDVYQGESTTIRNCTFSSNFAEHRGGGFAMDGSQTVNVEETIVWGNCAGESGDEVYSRSTLMFECSLVDSSGVDDHSVTYGADNLFTDPLFCEVAPCSETPTTSGNFRLTEGSPCLPESSPCGLLIGAFAGQCDLATTTGACCVYDGICEVRTSDDCLRVGGEFHTGASCAEIACPSTGACCFDDGQCTQVVEEHCIERGGTWLGTGTECGPSCPSGGGCCLPEDGCAILTAEACLDLGGTFRGLGSECATSCGPNTSGVLVVHAVESLSYTEDNDGYCGQSGLPACADIVSTVESPIGNPTPPPVILFVCAAFPPESSPSVTSVAFGISYSNTEIGILDHGPCGDDETTTSGWPVPGHGTEVSWFTPRSETMFEIYWFAARSYAGNPEQMKLVAHPVLGEAMFFETASHAGPSDVAACLGALGFDTEGVTCCPWTGESACCQTDGVCEVLPEEDCIELGGEFRLGWTCDPSPCDVSSAEEAAGLDEPGMLMLPSPNPARGEVAFEVMLDEPGHVTLTVFDVAGRHVATPLDEMRSAGSHVVRWNPADERRLVSGVYYVGAMSGDRTEMKQFLLLRE